MNIYSYKSNKDNSMDYSDSKTKSTPIAMVAPELKQSTDDTEITKTCAVLGCDDSKNLDPEMYFRFPEDPSLRQIWTDLTGRNNWTPTDYSYVCMQHFSVDCFMCDEHDEMVLVDNAVPSLKLPRHVLEVEYIEEEDMSENLEEEYLESDEEDADPSQVNGKTYMMDISIPQIKTEVLDNASISIKPETQTDNIIKQKKREEDNLELLHLFTEVQRMQRQAVGLRDKLKYNMRVHNRQNRHLARIKNIIEMKKKILNQKRKRKCRILLSLQDKIKEDTTGLVLAMPVKHTDEAKNFALSIYKYSPQAYIYIRNMLRTMLPATEVLDSWITSGYEPRNVVSGNTIKVVAEQTETELSCKVTVG